MQEQTRKNMNDDACSKLWCLEMIGLMERNGFFDAGTVAKVAKAVQ